MGLPIVEIVQFSLVVGMLFFVLFSDRKLGSYPAPLPQIRRRKRELIEAFLLWAVDVAVVSYLFLSHFNPSLPYPHFSVNSYITIDALLLESLILPPVFLRFWRRRSQERQAMGLGLKISWKPAAFFIILMSAFGFITFLVNGGQELPLPVLAWSLISPAFEEELLYRGAIQTKLERALTPRAAWLIGGVFFGLVHIPTDFFGPIWIYYGRNVMISLSFLLTQTAFGWLSGMFFIRSRSLYPSVIGHYLFDFFPNILAHFV